MDYESQQTKRPETETRSGHPDTHPPLPVGHHTMAIHQLPMPSPLATSCKHSLGKHTGCLPASLQQTGLAA